MKANRPFEPEPREPEPWPDPYPPSRWAWLNPSPESFVTVGTVSWPEHSFHSGAERKLAIEQEHRDRARYAVRGFSVGFGEYDREIRPGWADTPGWERDRTRPKNGG